MGTIARRTGVDRVSRIAWVSIARLRVARTSVGGISVGKRRVRDTQVIRVSPVTRRHRAMGCQATWEAPPIPVLGRQPTWATRLTRIPRPITLPTPVPRTDLPVMAIPATARRKTGRLESGTLSSLLAEHRPKVRPRSSTPLVRGEGERLRENSHGRCKISSAFDGETEPGLRQSIVTSCVTKSSCFPANNRQITDSECNFRRSLKISPKLVDNLVEKISPNGSKQGVS
jgi:hypothetical protein